MIASSLPRFFPLILITCATCIASLEAKQPNYSIDDDGSGKRGNDLSKENISKIREAFIGREFVLRINLNSNQLIFDGELIHNLMTPLERAPKNGFDYGTLVSPAGEVSIITGMNFQHQNRAMIHFRTQRGTQASLSIQSPLRNRKSYEKLNDKTTTPEWLESQLSNQVLRFLIPEASFNPNAIRATLPKAQSGLTFSGDAPIENINKSASRSRVSIFPIYLSELSVRVEPNRVRKGETVKLIIEYTIDGEQSEMIEADESRILEYRNNMLPGYPVEKTFLNDTGFNESEYLQTIPSTAAPGVYEFKGSVCINGECITRIAKFTVSD